MRFCRAAQLRWTRAKFLLLLMTSSSGGALPRSIQLESVRDWKNEGVWILVLMAWCYRLECMIYRSASKNYPLGDIEHDRMADSLHRAIFELDAVVRRAVTHRVGQFLPMSFSTAVATLIALCTELLLKPDIEPTDKLMSEEAVRTGIVFLIASQDTRPSLRWMLKMFSWAFRQTGLDFDTGLHIDDILTQVESPFTSQKSKSNRDLSSIDFGFLDFSSNTLFGSEYILNVDGFAP